VAVWSGSLMIVWGNGRTAGGTTRPRTRGPRPTRTKPPPLASGTPPRGPAPRWSSGAGTTGSPDGRHGGRYDLATDSWQPTAMAGAPSPGSSHRPVWTGTRVIVWGGQYGSTPSRPGLVTTP
jgi:hypothetical protein